MRLILVAASLATCAGATLTSQQAWRDPSRHDVRVVTVDADVRLDSNIRVPVLAMLDAPVLPAGRQWTDSERAVIDAFMARGRVLETRWIDKVKRHVADVRVVELPGAGHYVFLNREADVLREIHTFVASLPR
jgi:hypothetical protein